MSLDDIWNAHREGKPLSPVTAEEHFYVAVLTGSADEAALAASLAPDQVLYAETARYLRAGTAEQDVYRTPEAFTAFATGGGNVGLYRAAHEALRSAYAGQSALRLLDIGTGEGHGLLPALSGADVAFVDVVEPSSQRLAIVTAELARRSIEHQAHVGTVQDFMAGSDFGPPWDLVQETFALLAVPREERIALFKWLRERTKQVAFIEFDVPDLGDGPEWFRHLSAVYERGIREYDDNRDLVVQGFLVPVFLDALRGQLHTEQPIARWVEDLTAAGFQVEEPRKVFDYWWAPAYVLRAS